MNGQTEVEYRQYCLKRMNGVKHDDAAPRKLVIDRPKARQFRRRYRLERPLRDPS